MLLFLVCLGNRGLKFINVDFLVWFYECYVSDLTCFVSVGRHEGCVMDGLVPSSDDDNRSDGNTDTRLYRDGRTQ